MGLACYGNSSVDGGMITKTEDRRLVIDLSKTQFTLSDENSITGISVDDMVVGNTRHANGSSITTICATVLQPNYMTASDGFYGYGECQSGDGVSEYWPGNGCCWAPIPKGN